MEISAALRQARSLLTLQDITQSGSQNIKWLGDVTDVSV